jgi:hypothetical protein
VTVGALLGENAQCRGGWREPTVLRPVLSGPERGKLFGWKRTEKTVLNAVRLDQTVCLISIRAVEAMRWSRALRAAIGKEARVLSGLLSDCPLAYKSARLPSCPARLAMAACPRTEAGFAAAEQHDDQIVVARRTLPRNELGQASEVAPVGCPEGYIGK